MNFLRPISEVRWQTAARPPKSGAPVPLGWRRRRSGLGFGFPVWTMLLIAAAMSLGRCQIAAQTDTGLRVGFSSAMFTDVNENDAKAAVKIWGQTVAKQRGIPTQPETHIFQSTQEILEALRSKSVDAVGITMIEYAVASREVRFDPIFVTYTGQRAREQYLVLVRNDSRVDHLADLRGRSVIFHDNSRVRLAQPWLDTLLIPETGKPAADWLGKITLCPKLSKVVLPVFFHQSDACVVFRTSFETMCELNPQIGQQLKVLVFSPEVVPAVFCFRADYAPAFKEPLFAGIRELHKSPAGLQVLTIFQSDKIEDEPASCLDGALEILARHAQLTGADYMATNTQPHVVVLQKSQGGNP